MKNIKLSFVFFFPLVKPFRLDFTGYEFYVASKEGV